MYTFVSVYTVFHLGNINKNNGLKLKNSAYFFRHYKITRLHKKLFSESHYAIVFYFLLMQKMTVFIELLLELFWRASLPIVGTSKA